MATQTLAQAKLFINDEIVTGIVEDIITTNPIYQVMPFTGYSGQAILVNREETLGNAQNLAIGGEITAKGASTSVQTPYTAITIIGDAEMNGLVQAQSQSAGVDQMMAEVSSKAKSVGRLIQEGMASGTGTSPQMHSLPSLCDASQYTTAAATQALSFELLDELLDLVKAKDGEVDYLVANGAQLRKYRALVRQLGGVNETIAFDMGNGRSRNIDVYNNVPIFQNDWIGSTETANGAALAGGALTSIYAGCFDDGTQKIGQSFIHPEGVPAGIAIDQVGVAELKDNTITRVKAYANFVNFNRRGLARLTSLT
tara:strand:+ start:5895 stop:6830 length:936 start_codon:yes stop_codon:yes gene_type:complete